MLPTGASGVAATPPSLRLRRSFTLPPALPSIGGAVAGTPYRLRCTYHVMTHHDGGASCHTTQISPSWPRAGHPCGDTAVPLPAGFVCGRVHRAGREPGILVGIPRCRYQLALSAAMGAMVLGSELTKLAASRASLKGYHGAVTSWLCPSPIHRRSGAVTRIKPDVTKLAVSYRATL